MRAGRRRRRPRRAAHAPHGRHATDGYVQEGDGADLGRRVRGCHGRLPGGRREEHAGRNRVRHQRADRRVSVGGLSGPVHRLADRRPYRRQARASQGVSVQPAAVRLRHYIRRAFPEHDVHDSHALLRGPWPGVGAGDQFQHDQRVRARRAPRPLVRHRLDHRQLRLAHRHVPVPVLHHHLEPAWAGVVAPGVRGHRRGGHHRVHRAPGDAGKPALAHPARPLRRGRGHHLPYRARDGRCRHFAR